MPFAHRSTQRIHYQVFGRDDAPPLLLIMGLALSSRAWHTLPELLQNEFRVIVLDNSGTGRSTPPRRFYRTRDMADDAAAVLDALKLDSAFVFGISMGGMIAQELAVRHPRRVRALVLGCTFAGHLRSTKPSPRIALELLRVVFGSRRKLGAHAARLLVSPEYLAADRDGFDRWVATIEQAPVGVAVRQMGAIVLHESRKRLRDLRVPTLVITGDADRLVPPRNSHTLAKLIPGARLLVLPGAGHVFPVERPAETVRALREFFIEVDRGEAPGASSSGVE